MLVVEGDYRNEVTGKVSDNKIRLKAITDLSKHTTANVNLLTDLEFERVYHLVTKKKNKVYEAKRTAQTEILDIFHMALTDKTDAEDMDVFGNSDADAALLAISILLQGDRTEAELMALLAEISLAMAETGKWEGARADSIKTSMADWAFGHDMSKFRKNVEGWGLSDKKPGDFEKFVENFIAKTYGITVCSAVSTAKQQVNNSRSIFHGKKYECYKDDGMTRATWVDIRRNNPYLKAGINYGHLIDWRDRRMYNTIELGYIDSDDGTYYFRRVMAENLDFEYRVNGVVYGNICARADCDADGKPYGRFYRWSAAMDSAGVYSTDGLDCGDGKTCTPAKRSRGVCPEGWALDDWQGFLDYNVGLNVYEQLGFGNVSDAKPYFGKVLKTTTDWEAETVGSVTSDGNGSDLLGFSAFPAGYGKVYSEWFPYLSPEELEYVMGLTYHNQGISAGFWTSSEEDAEFAYAYEIRNNQDDITLEDQSKSVGLSVRCFQ